MNEVTNALVLMEEVIWLAYIFHTKGKGKPKSAFKLRKLQAHNGYFPLGSYFLFTQNISSSTERTYLQLQL